MKMTRKQVDAYVDDINNWEIIDASKYLRLTVLRTGKHSFCRIGYRTVENKTEIYLHKAEPETGWFDPSLYIFDEENDCIGYSTSITDIKNTIYKDFKEDAA